MRKKQVYAAILLFFKSAFILTEGVKMLLVILKEFLQEKFAESRIDYFCEIMATLFDINLFSFYFINGLWNVYHNIP